MVEEALERPVLRIVPPVLSPIIRDEFIDVP